MSINLSGPASQRSITIPSWPEYQGESTEITHPSLFSAGRNQAKSRATFAWLLTPRVLFEWNQGKSLVPETPVGLYSTPVNQRYYPHGNAVGGRGWLKLCNIIVTSTTMETNERTSEDSPVDHKCNFSLQETSSGYLSGAYVCKQCGNTATREQFLQSHTPSPD